MYCTTLYKNYSINCVCSVCIFAAHQWCSSIQYYPVCRLQYAVLPSMQYYPVCSIAQYGALSSMQHTQNAGRSMQYYPVCSIPSVQYYPVCRLQSVSTSRVYLWPPLSCLLPSGAEEAPSPRCSTVEQTGSPPDFGKSKSKWVGEPDYGRAAAR